MANQKKSHTFSFQEVVECLIKKQDIHSGLWGILVSFTYDVINEPDDDEPNVYYPAVVAPLMEIGIQRFDEPSNLTVDAAVVNPRPSKAKKTRLVKQKEKQQN